MVLKSKKQVKGRKLHGGGIKKRRTQRFIVECKNAVEDGIMKVHDFVSIICVKLVAPRNPGTSERGLKINHLEQQM
ncbi:unnamed protein product [Gongylonema pulchrum]|uniref:MADS-box domain-containing protein n=1 Tax=Gongylonema pulchrum TaxID=637853 RepID=A0A183F101_9BILA|nr:unnamed protein product [Gongylonema pulchrum]